MHYRNLCSLPLSSSKFVYYRVEGDTPLDRRVRIVAKSPYEICHVSTTLCMHQRGSHWADVLDIFTGGLLRKSVKTVNIQLKPGKNVGHFTWTPRSFLLLPATLNCHKSEWNGIRLLGEPRRYKHYANAPQCYDICILPLLLQFAFGFRWSRIAPFLYVATL